MFQLGLRMTLGEGAEKNPAEGARLIRQAAEAGHDKAMAVLSEMYEKGVGVKQSESEAVRWCQKAADAGLPECIMNLALRHQNGQGVVKDVVKAAALAEEGARKGFSPAQTFYASKLMQGDGLEKNPSKAALWYLKAAKQDHPFAQRQLAYLYYTGTGVQLDYERCLAWYRRAVRVSEDPMAKNDLAWFLAICPDPKFHKAEEAVTVARTAVMELEVSSGQQDHAVVDTMAAALARNGQFAEALVWQKRCLKLLEEDPEASPEEKSKLKAEFQERLKLYQEQKPYADKPATPNPDAEPLYNDTILEDLDKPSRPSGTDTPQRGRTKKANDEAA
jgi:TPR repeat protein